MFKEKIRPIQGKMKKRITGLTQGCFSMGIEFAKVPEIIQNPPAIPTAIKGGAVPVGIRRNTNTMHRNNTSFQLIFFK